MPEAAEKQPILPKGFTLPVITLPTVLPTDAVALTALLHSVIPVHDASNKKALDYINYLDSWDHVPIRSWPLFKARYIFRTLFANDKPLPITWYKPFTAKLAQPI
jgi:hypothetical protein